VKEFISISCVLFVIMINNTIYSDIYERNVSRFINVYDVLLFNVAPILLSIDTAEHH